jgi:cytochrome o ubiquinol oxidase subunit 2
MARLVADAKIPIRRGAFVRPLRGAAAVLLVPLALTGCARGVLQPQGPVAGANSLILLNAVGIMSAIVVPTIAALVGIAWWFRASNTRARYQPGFVYSGRLELIVWAIPILVILFLSGLTWTGSHELDPFVPIASNNPKDPPLEVQVISLDWKWLFVYPQQQVAAVNELVVPTETPLHFFLTSATVMNQFFVPQLGSMIATMNGMQTQLWLKADHAGTYYGTSAQYSGDGFSGMHFDVHAVSQSSFQNWIDSTKRDGPVLDRNGYFDLLRPSCDVQPFTYRSADPALFSAVVKRQLPPGPGPFVGRAGPGVRPVGCE